MINYKTEKRSFIIYNSSKETIIYYKTTWHYKNGSIPIGRDLAIEDTYKKQDINKSI